MLGQTTLSDPICCHVMSRQFLYTLVYGDCVPSSDELMFGSSCLAKQTSLCDHCETSVTNCFETACVLGMDVRKNVLKHVF